jgi:hypothetical protein
VPHTKAVHQVFTWGRIQKLCIKIVTCCRIQEAVHHQRRRTMTPRENFPIRLQTHAGPLAAAHSDTPFCILRPDLDAAFYIL